MIGEKIKRLAGARAMLPMRRLGSALQLCMVSDKMFTRATV
jgi:hypothetical protein